jgi:two-component system chemotaxis response regulator CheB
MEENHVKRSYRLVVIGGSAGSLDVILKMLTALPGHLPAPVVIVLHRKNSNDNLLADLLSTKTSLRVKEVEEKEPIRPGYLYIAPADYHLLIEKDYSFSLDDSEKINYSRPSIDATFETAADVYSSSLIGILLSGANTDGVEGLKKIKQSGGLTIVQEPDSAEVSYMPQQAINNVDVDIVADAAAIGGVLIGLLGG